MRRCNLRTILSRNPVGLSHRLLESILSGRPISGTIGGTGIGEAPVANLVAHSRIVLLPLCLSTRYLEKPAIRFRMLRGEKIMQRDKVLGLSLAILLIGFAGAFCFRNETSSIFSGPQLQNPRALDDAIADKEGPKPYPGDLQGTKQQATPTGVTLEGIVAESPFASSSDPNQAPSGAGKKADRPGNFPTF
jgi:hypothetical protein